MTISVSNTANTDTFLNWLARTNQIAYALSNSVVTTDSNTTVGNATITGTFTANLFSTANFISIGNSTVNVVVNSTSVGLVNLTYTSGTGNSLSLTSRLSVGNSSINAVVNSSSLVLSNSTVNLAVTMPTSTQVSNGQYFFNANGSWTQVATYNPIVNGSMVTVGNSAQIIDSFAKATYNFSEWTVSVTNSSVDHHITKIIGTYNSSNVYSTEYGTITTGPSFGTFTVNANTTHVSLYITPASSTSANVTFVRISS